MRYLIGSVRVILFFVFTILIYLGYNFVLLFVKHTDERGFKMRQVFLKVIIFFMGMRIDKKGQSDFTPALYVCNHRGLMDFFIVLRFFDAFILSKDEVQKIPIFPKAAGYTGVFYVKRDKKSSRGAARQAIVDLLKKGRNVLIFPEGTTNIERTTTDFKKGAFEEASKLGMPVVPIALEYKSRRDYWKDISMSKMFFSQYGKIFTRCKVEFGPPIYNDDASQMMNSAKMWIDDKLIEMQEGWSEVY